MKKVLIITNHSYMFWQFRRELVAAILEQGHQVMLAVPFGDCVEELRSLGCTLIDTPMNRRGMSPMQELSLMRRYRSILDTVKPDLVITYSIKPNLYAGLLCGRRNIPCCINVQGLGTAFQNPVTAAFVSGLYRAAVRRAKVVFFENEENARIFRDKKIISRDRQCILRGAGINLDRYTRQPYPEHETVRFLYLGRIMREKGMDELFEAVRRLYREGEQFHLDLVGFFEDSYRDQVGQLEQLGVCTFHGFQSETRPFYGNADCVVLPSYHEGMSNVLLEGAAVGRPLITSAISGCREAVEEGVTGFTCPARDPDALYETMKKFLHLSREQRAAMGAAGRRKMQAEFDKKLVVENTLAAIFREESHV